MKHDIIINMNGIKIIIAFVCGFIVAQIIKFIIDMLHGDLKKYNKKTVRSLIGMLCRSGGMPSGHASSFVAATTCVGLLEGFDSVVFALGVCFTLIVLYDSVNVRFIVGEQGKALNKIISRPIRIAEGHTITEVLFGILLGIVLGVAIYYFF